MVKIKDWFDAASRGNLTVLRLAIIEFNNNNKIKKVQKYSFRAFESLRKSRLASSLPMESIKGIFKIAHIDTQDFTTGNTALHLSCLNGHVDAVSLLLKGGANAFAKDVKCCTPLHLASWNGSLEICEMLLQENIKSVGNSCVNISNSDGETPLHVAVKFGHIEVIKLLIKHNADPLIANFNNESSFDLACQFGRDDVIPDLICVCGKTLRTIQHFTHCSPLHLATREAHINIVKQLLCDGFQINALTENGTALHEAAINYRLDIARYLLENGADSTITNATGQTALQLLTLKNYFFNSCKDSELVEELRLLLEMADNVVFNSIELVYVDDDTSPDRTNIKKISHDLTAENGGYSDIDEHSVEPISAGSLLQRHSERSFEAGRSNSNDGYLTPIKLTLCRPVTQSSSVRGSWSPHVARAVAWNGHTPCSSRQTSDMSLFADRSKVPPVCYADLTFSTTDPSRSRGPNDPLPSKPIHNEMYSDTSIQNATLTRSASVDQLGLWLLKNCGYFDDENKLGLVNQTLLQSNDNLLRTVVDNKDIVPKEHSYISCTLQALRSLFLKQNNHLQKREHRISCLNLTSHSEANRDNSSLSCTNSITGISGMVHSNIKNLSEQIYDDVASSSSKFCVNTLVRDSFDKTVFQNIGNQSLYEIMIVND